MVSPVLDNIMERPVKHGSSERVIPILGVPCDAVTAFIKYLYNSMLVHGRANGEIWNSPASIITRLFGATAEAAVQQGSESAADGGECGGRAPTRQALRRTRPLPQEHDPWLELHILRFMDEAES
ncbi:hypothetical protein Gotri_008419, partial [Gossypium trilobum]|nr:hypothetical protein [Gossypium trilobum]